MRLEVGDAQITDVVIGEIESLQLDEKVTAEYLNALDEVTRMVILDINGIDEDDSRTLSLLRPLQMIRRAIVNIATASDLDDPANDYPTVVKI